MARHAIHVCETLDVAIENVSSMIQQYTSFPEDRSFKSSYEKKAFMRTTQCFQSQLQTLKGLKARSASNQARMQNEITLVALSRAGDCRSADRARHSTLSLNGTVLWH